MNKASKFFMIAVGILGMACGGTQNDAETNAADNAPAATTEEAMASPAIKAVKLDYISAKMQDPSDTLHVLNFWATWCKPCIKELPYFEQVRENTEGKAIKFSYVNLDFADEIESKVRPFVEKKQLGGEVVLLDEPDQNYFINAIDSAWSGAIPATLFVAKGGAVYHFHEGEYTRESLEQQIDELLSQ